MRQWVKYALWILAIACVCFMVLAGTSAYYVFRHLETRTATEADSRPDFDAVRKRFNARAPMIEIVNPKAGDIRIRREGHPEGLRAETVHILAWEAEDDRLLRTDVPLWLMRFNSINILSHLGIAPSRYRLVVEDLKRFGPGLVVDYKQAGKSQVLIWLE